MPKKVSLEAVAVDDAAARRSARGCAARSSRLARAHVARSARPRTVTSSAVTDHDLALPLAVQRRPPLADEGERLVDDDRRLAVARPPSPRCVRRRGTRRTASAMVRTGPAGETTTTAGACAAGAAASATRRAAGDDGHGERRDQRAAGPRHGPGGGSRPGTAGRPRRARVRPRTQRAGACDPSRPPAVAAQAVALHERQHLGPAQRAAVHAPRPAGGSAAGGGARARAPSASRRRVRAPEATLPPPRIEAARCLVIAHPRRRAARPSGRRADEARQRTPSTSKRLHAARRAVTHLRRRSAASVIVMRQNGARVLAVGDARRGRDAAQPATPASAASISPTRARVRPRPRDAR